jgi:hypothetical protein
LATSVDYVMARVNTAYAPQNVLVAPVEPGVEAAQTSGGSR